MFRVDVIFVLIYTIVKCNNKMSTLGLKVY